MRNPSVCVVCCAVSAAVTMDAVEGGLKEHEPYVSQLDRGSWYSEGFAAARSSHSTASRTAHSACRLTADHLATVQGYARGDRESGETQGREELTSSSKGTTPPLPMPVLEACIGRLGFFSGNTFIAAFCILSNSDMVV